MHAPTGATLTVLDDEHVGLRVPLAGDRAVEIRITVPASVSTGGAPVVTEADADAAMSALLGVAAGQELPTVKKGAARITLGCCRRRSPTTPVSPVRVCRRT